MSTKSQTKRPSVGCRTPLLKETSLNSNRNAGFDSSQMASFNAPKSTGKETASVDLSHSWPIYNNQSDEFMITKNQNCLMILHDTRIFYFGRDSNEQSKDAIALDYKEAGAIIDFLLC